MCFNVYTILYLLHYEGTREIMMRPFFLARSPSNSVLGLQVVLYIQFLRKHQAEDIIA